MTLAHWLYVLGVLVVIATMVSRRNVVIPSIVFTFLLGLVVHGSLVKGVQTIFDASFTAATELFNIFLIIGLMVAMLKVLSLTGADEKMITPLRKLFVSPTISYIVLAVTTLVVALFFWPTPSVPLVGGLLAPVAIAAGLPPMMAAMAIALAGQGMALAGDVIIQGAPKITASAAGVPVELVLVRGGILTLIAGVVALGLGYILMRPEIAKFKAQRDAGVEVAATAAAMRVGGTAAAERVDKPGVAGFLAALVPIVMLLAIVAMFQFKILGGDASALLGGAAAVILVLGSLLSKGWSAFDDIADYIADGFIFAFKIMGPIIPIAGFFFLGAGYLADVGNMLSAYISGTGVVAHFGMLIVGMITGLDGSGFSGLPLVGALAGALAPGSPVHTATLGAVGQIGAIWSGGGTLVAWCSLIAVAGMVGVPVLDLVRKNLVPVLAGLFVATLVAVLFM